MRSRGLSLVCLSLTYAFVGCGPEPAAKGPTPTSSATSAPTTTPAASASAAPDATTAPTSSAAAAAPTTSNAPTSSPDTMPLVGDLSNAEIQKAINDNIKAFDSCYTLGADKQGKLEGTITVKATVGPLGNVKDASVVKSTIKNPKVDACVVAAFKKVTFPKPRGGVAVITYPMTFGGEMVVKK